MINKDIYIVIAVVFLITLFLRILPVYIKISDNNKYVETFFELLPSSIITVLVFPEIFSSMGTSLYDIVLSIMAIVYVVILSIKKISLGYIAISTTVLILILRGIYFGIF